jgi:hypothetical protein
MFFDVTGRPHSFGIFEYPGKCGPVYFANVLATIGHGYEAEMIEHSNIGNIVKLTLFFNKLPLIVSKPLFLHILKKTSLLRQFVLEVCMCFLNNDSQGTSKFVNKALLILIERIEFDILFELRSFVVK